MTLPASLMTVQSNPSLSIPALCRLVQARDLDHPQEQAQMQEFGSQESEATNPMMHFAIVK